MLGRGFIADQFGRKSEPMTYVIHVSKAPAMATVSMETYWRESPVTVCVSFSQEVAMAAENVESAAAFTLTSTETCKYQLSFLPETDPSFPAANYAYSFELKNLESIYGNPAAGALQTTYYYYHSQPVAVVPTEPIVMSTLGRGRKGEIVVEFDRAMEALPTTLDELLVIAGESTPLSTYVNLVSVSGEGARFTIVLEPKTLAESYMTLTAQFAPDALVDAAGNNALACDGDAGDRQPSAESGVGAPQRRLSLLRTPAYAHDFLLDAGGAQRELRLDGVCDQRLCVAVVPCDGGA